MDISFFHAITLYFSYQRLCQDVALLGGNYERGLYNQLMERLDTVEKESKKEITTNIVQMVMNTMPNVAPKVKKNLNIGCNAANI